MNAGNQPLVNEHEAPLSISQLTARIKQTLEQDFASVWVVGEITDLARPRSGHVYLTLKDERAQIRGVMWRSAAARLPFELQDGQQVVCRGDIDVYPPRGSYQLVIRQIEPRGEGALQQALRRLQKRLAAEGLFDPGHKIALPRFPRRIALITSPTGAAVRDFLEVVRRRWRATHVLVLPVRVQGDGAAVEIAHAIQLANQLHPPMDVLVVTRGGGSMEDLWCFNEEPVVRAIFASMVPVVSAIGHEIDVTLSDLVADLRALTPTEAAERVVPSADQVSAVLDQMKQRIDSLLRGRVQAARSRLDQLAARRPLRQPMEMLYDRARRLDELQMRAQRAIEHRLRQARQRIAAQAGRLESLSPLAVLARGYTITQRADDDALLTDARSAPVGLRIRTRYAQGSTISRVERSDELPDNVNDDEP